MPEPPRILALTTSTRRSSAAVVWGERVLGAAYHADETSHAERLFALVDEALGRAGCRRAELGAIACDVGPGSFTGVRVALAAAHAIAFALGIPLLGVGSLEAMAAAGRAGGEPGPCLALLDARRAETFLALYGDGCLAPPRHLPNAEIADEARRLAAGAELCVAGEQARALDLDGEPLLHLLASPACDLPDAGWVGRVAARRLAAGAWDPSAPVDAAYVRPPDAKPMAGQGG